MKVFISSRKEFHNDYLFVEYVVGNMDNVSLVESIEECDVYLVLVGMYLTHGYKESIEAETNRAIKLSKKTYVVCGHGSPYIPKFFRDLNLEKRALVKRSLVTI